ncbi:hypothetical protein PIB30_085976 [Stylosanthes scabra]|uniref:Putative plant transposon protein domain-containing protein n=1 Tax=Stylosanthes scabra TaxID=79078 RepID=A0ABU6UU41_9FABA|nr:hypothetical protein [Stylosanthes scabra]
MASSSAPARKCSTKHFFESNVRRKKIIPEVGFNLEEDKYPQIKEQIALRGWRRLAAPTTGISKLLVQEFYANAAVSDEELENIGQIPYKSYVRAVEVDFSTENIRRVMRFKAKTQGAEMDNRTRQATDQRLDEGWQEFIIHSLVPTRNKSEITVARAILIHAIMRGEDVRVEDIIADNMAMIVQGLHGKGNLSFPSTIYKLCKDAGVPLREFKRTSRIPEEKLITAKRMESTRLPRNVPQQQQDEDEPMPQAGGGNEEDQEQQQYHQFQQPPQQHYQEF